MRSIRKSNKAGGCYPFQSDEPFVLEESPHVFFIGNQPAFGTTLVSGPSDQSVRLIAVPSFKDTGQVVLVSTDTLEVQLLQVSLFNND